MNRMNNSARVRKLVTVCASFEEDGVGVVCQCTGRSPQMERHLLGPRCAFVTVLYELEKMAWSRQRYISGRESVKSARWGKCEKEIPCGPH